MKTNELFENKASKQLTRAEKDAKRGAGRAELEKQVAARAVEKKAEFDKKFNAGGPKTITLPVIAAGGKVEKRDFIIDNYLAQVHKMDDVTLKDLSQAPVIPGERKEKPSYAIVTNNKHVEGSIPAYLHGLPRKTTRRKAGYAPNDFRREVYE